MSASIWEKLKVFFGFVEESDPFEAQSSAQPEPAASGQPEKSFKGALMNTQNAKPFPASEIKVEEPRVYEDSLNISAHLRLNKPVIVNLKYLDTTSSKRLIDFICGTAYAINGHMMKIGENIFLFTPSNIHIADSEERDPLEAEPVMEPHQKEAFFNKMAI